MPDVKGGLHSRGRTGTALRETARKLRCPVSVAKFSYTGHSCALSCLGEVVVLFEGDTDSPSPGDCFASGSFGSYRYTVDVEETNTSPTARGRRLRGTVPTALGDDDDDDDDGSGTEEWTYPSAILAQGFRSCCCC